MHEASDTTSLIRAWNRGSADAGEQLMARIYPDLQQLARRAMLPGSGISCRPSDLAQDLYLKLADQRDVSWQDRRHLLAVAARLCRRIVLDHARHRRRLKRGGHWQRVDFERDLSCESGTSVDVLAVDQALSRLAGIDASAVEVVKLHFFGGLSLEDCGLVLGMARATVVRRWRFARSWLHRELTA
ncbi:MAG: ECF-type sigma factor [Thermoanaerobaculia bacterium]|nr:ECF-type sigma factor [Thermoanaerobaculia bacterium]